MFNEARLGSRGRTRDNNADGCVLCRGASPSERECDMSNTRDDIVSLDKFNGPARPPGPAGRPAPNPPPPPPQAPAPAPGRPDSEDPYPREPWEDGRASSPWDVNEAGVCWVDVHRAEFKAWS